MSVFAVYLLCTCHGVGLGGGHNYENSRKALSWKTRMNDNRMHTERYFTKPPRRGLDCVTQQQLGLQNWTLSCKIGRKSPSGYVDTSIAVLVFYCNILLPCTVLSEVKDRFSKISKDSVNSFQTKFLLTCFVCFAAADPLLGEDSLCLECGVQ